MSNAVGVPGTGAGSSKQEKPGEFGSRYGFAIRWAAPTPGESTRVDTSAAYA
jgi:hypothetical protein